MNTTKCKDCQHYDEIRSGKARVHKYGWCSVKSVYPFAEEAGGRVFPPGVKRVSSPELPAKPVIVTGEGVETNCMKVAPR